MKIQVDIPKELNKKLKIYKIENDLNDLQEVVINVLSKYFKEVKNDKRKK